MKGSFSVPGDYIYFKSQVPLHKIPIGSKQWRYYDFGPKYVPPLICLPGIAGTADVYYKQIMSLSNKVLCIQKLPDTNLLSLSCELHRISVEFAFAAYVVASPFEFCCGVFTYWNLEDYRVISVDIPLVWNNQEWIQAFEKFLDVIDVHHIHLYGTSLGGFLAQLFAQHRPRRVKSLVLSNTFLETSNFSAAMPWAPIVGWAPSFLLKRYVLTGIRDGPHEPFIADSVDFVVAQVETLSKDDLASRLSLTVDSASVGPLRLSDTFITIMDTNDFCAVPQELKDQVIERYPGARLANLKSGGDFPFLSRPDEVNLHLQLHLRRVGVEAQPEYVQGTNRDGAGESSSNQNNERGGVDNESKDEMRDYIGVTNENSVATNENESSVALETPFLGNFDNEVLRNVHLSIDE
ncbi:hypothetical protein SASPL_143130 [Salvia splendens]|uniref:Maspardin n=1 Tax=Salvia splendens TaxID=180675 RepID=A0A8X8WLF4_SALSN|nr:hypothetical protein SASPL_143130 [Salvia splendens]